MERKKTLYLIDGHSYIYRAFYAIRELTNSKGFPTNAIYGFTNMLLKIIREKMPDYLCVVFDSPVPTKRHRLYEAYKAQRPKMPDTLGSQMPYIKEIVNAFRIPTLEIAGEEADDILGSLSKKAEREGIETVIVTADKDIYQLLSTHIKGYDSMRDRFTEEKDVIERFGVPPARIPEIMALMGDAIDNIPGVSGIGEKTAVELIRDFGELDNLLENADKVRKPKLRSSIIENMDKVRLSRSLATINTNIPVDIPIDGLTIREPDWPELIRLFKEFEFSRLLRLIPKVEMDGREYATALSMDDINKALSEIKTEMCIDTETTNRDPIKAELVGISISPYPKKAYYIPLRHNYSGVPEQPLPAHVMDVLRPVIEDPSIKKIGHNIKYDLIVLRKEGVELNGISFDTMLCSYLLNPNKSNHSLEEVCLDYLTLRKLSFEDVMKKGMRDFSEVPIEDATRYSCEDAALTMELKHRLFPLIKEMGIDKLFYDVELPLIDVLADMEEAGMRIDTEKMHVISKELERGIDSIQRRIYFLAGEEFNINSPKQLRTILFEKLGLQPKKKTKTGYSTEVGVLEELALEHELPKEILEYRTLTKLKNTYVDALPMLIDAKTQRLHTSFNQTVTATGRLSSSEPNLQNIPVKGEWGRRIRDAFIAADGSLLISSDYSQIELRILAHLSQDEGLMSAFRDSIDIHTRTASELFGVVPDDVTPEMRRRAKTVNFGIVYGISPYGLSKELGISAAEARQYIDRYFEKHRGVKQYIENTIKEARDKGYVTTILCRRRSIPELLSSNSTTRQLGERLAVNSPIQGSAADLIKLAMLNIWRRLRKEAVKTRIILQVHDELLLDAPQEEIDVVTSLVKEEMEGVIDFSVPLKVDIGVGKTWAEAH